ncbi:hypothetical protein MCOR11_010011 [Pyricularia oryzae]|nr:hypothetical protein MCOR11_010011 [Pyricularia oryzae]
MAKYVDAAKQDLREDVTWQKAGRLSRRGIKEFPEASVQYLLDKAPIIGWLPKYNPRWLINDAIAGLTLGLMLIPQGLAYAKIAEIPVEYGLMSSWLPASIYAIMGTTKDLSTGPTSLIGLLTSEGVHEFGEEYTPSQVASAMALWMGVFGMVLGFLKLGWLLEFISLPILSGFITAVAITIALNQMPSLLGISGVGSGTAQQIHDVFAFLPRASLMTCVIGFTGILMMTILEKMGKRWSDKNKIVWFCSITRAFLTLVLFTGVSYAVNGKKANAKQYMFEVVQVKAQGLEQPGMPPSDLIMKTATRSIALFIAAAVEHSAIARAFGVKNDYIPDQSQELCYFGVTNFVNSFFHAMGVGGAMSRTSVNSQCHVKSPLSGLMTTAVVLISIYFLVGTLYWIPKATLAAIIITAVWPLIHPPSDFYRYWKTSLADFISSMIALWVSLFYSTEMGIGLAVGFNVLYCILRQTFTRVTASGIPAPSDISDRDLPHPDSPQARDVHVFRFNDSFFFPNSYMCSTAILDSIQTYHAPAYHGAQGPEVRERNWSVVAEKRIQRLRRRAGVTDPDALPPIGLVVLDFGRVNHVDSTACSHLKNLAKEISRYGGKHVELRFVGMTEYVRERFVRYGWKVDDAPAWAGPAPDKDATLLFPTVAAAVLAPRRNDAPEVVQHDFDEKRSSSEDLEKGMAMHAETADRSSSQERKTEARP